MRTIGAVVLGLVLAASAKAAEEIKVTPIELVETRAKQFVKEVKFASHSELKLILHVEGNGVNDATSYGKIKFDQAVDNAGGNLKPKKKGMFSFGGGDWTSLRGGAMGMRQKKGEKGFRIELSLAASSRKATGISRLKGEFPVLAGGQAKTVTVAKLKSQLGKKIEDPALKAAGLEIRILDPKKEKGGGLFGLGGDNSLPIEAKGNLSALRDVDVVDAKGKGITSGSMSMGSDDKKTYSYDLKKPLDDTMTLQLKLMVGQKEVTVPFDLKDIELP